MHFTKLRVQPTLFTLTFQYFYTYISAIFVTFCNSDDEDDDDDDEEEEEVANCPTRLSLLMIFGFLYFTFQIRKIYREEEEYSETDETMIAVYLKRECIAVSCNIVISVSLKTISYISSSLL